MRSETRFAGISLSGDPNRLDQGPIQIKLFFEPDDQARYAEAYANIDLQARNFEFAEKDVDYRAPLVRAFAKE